MSFSLLNILAITGSLALFIFGMKVMSDGIQKAARGQLRRTLRNVTKRPLSGIAVGLLTTGVMQSSSATTVMTISFVNAGLITVTQSVGILMGANIGTTITAWIVSFGGFLFKLSSITLPLLTIAIPLYFRGNKMNRYWSEFIIGFALLFIGLDFLKASLPTLENIEVFEAIKSYAGYGFSSRILFVIVGIILTMIVQSSSAAMTLTIALVFNEMIPMELGCAMILGENIGTTVTAEIAALVGNVHARRSASVHTMFNVIGVLWMIFFMGVIISVIEAAFDLFTSQKDSFANLNYATIGLAAFHTSFNVLNTLLILPFINLLVKLVSRLRSQQSKKDVRSKLKYINTGIGTPELSSVQMQAELAHMSTEVVEMASSVQEILNSSDISVIKDIHKKLKKKAKRNNNNNTSISEYVIKMARSEITEDTSVKLQKYIAISADLNRLSNICVNISYELKDKIDKKIWFTPDQRTNLNIMTDKVMEGMTLMSKNLEREKFHEVDIAPFEEIEAEVNRMRDAYRSELGKMGKEFDFNMSGSLIYFRLFTLLEKMGDKVYEVSAKMSDEVL